MPAIAIALVLALFVVAGAALAYIAGAGAVLAFFATGNGRYLALAPQLVFSQLDVFALMAMPLFILVGEIMNRGGITQALVDFSMSLVGRLKGGLGHVNIMTSVFFAGISGAAMADAAALSNTLVPAMREKGYATEYAGAITAASSIIGPIIPPSIILIFYGAIMGVDVAALFAAGIGPGLLLAAALMATNTWFAHAQDHPGGRTDDIQALWPSFKRAAPALLLPLIIITGIIFGVMTPTEAAAVAVAAAIGVGFWYAKLDLSGLRVCFRRAAVLSGSIFVLFATASLFIYLAALTRFPQDLADFVTGLGLSGGAFMLAVTAVFIFCGMVLDTMIGLALIAPILVPVALSQGADPVHMGILICLNLAIGLITPPLGGAALVVSSVTGLDYWRLFRALAPFIVVELLVLLAVVFVPEISLALPRALGLI